MFVYQILIHTPPWVWILLAYLVWQGIKSMRPRKAPIWRALIVPVVFIAWGVSRIGFGHQDNQGPLVAWVVAALVLLPLGVLTPRPFDVDHKTGEIIRPGSGPTGAVFLSVGWPLTTSHAMPRGGPCRLLRER